MPSHGISYSGPGPPTLINNQGNPPPPTERSTDQPDRDNSSVDLSFYIALGFPKLTTEIY